MGRATVGARPFVLFAILCAVYAGADPALVEPPDFVATGPETVNRTFSRCDGPHGHACVVDGDTFRLGKRRIRIIGIDTPETHPPRCAEEARLGEAATARLQQLLNDGPFEMVGYKGDLADKYGRELRAVRRRKGDGSYTSIAAVMRDEGHARRYLGGWRGGWC